MDTPKGFQTIISDDVTDALTSPINDKRWKRVLKARTLYEDREELDQEGHIYVFDSLEDLRWRSDGQLELLVRWFGYNDQDDKWQNATSLPREAVRKYCVHKTITQASVTRRGFFFLAAKRRALRR